MRFDSLREITVSLQAEARKLRHLNIHMMPSRSTLSDANEAVPSDIKFTSAATNDSFMLKPATLSKGDIMAMDRAYLDYEKFEQLTERGVVCVTKMKKNLKYSILTDTMYQTPILTSIVCSTIQRKIGKQFWKRRPDPRLSLLFFKEGAWI